MDYDNDALFDIAPPISIPPHLDAGGSHAVSGLDDDTTEAAVAEWEEAEPQDRLVRELMRHWTNERLAPDILEQRGELIQSALDRVEEQARLVRELRADPEVSEDEHFQIILVQTEVERIRFIIRSYMRTRLDKVERYARYILEHPEIQMRLTTIELTHAQKYAALMDAQYNASVLNALPPHLRHERTYDDMQGIQQQPKVTRVPKMALEPDKDSPLFVHALQDCGRVRLPDGDSLEIKKGSIHLVRYVTIEENLRRGELELV